MPWPGTKTNMTADGGNDLKLDEGYETGSYEYTSVDCAWAGYHYVDLHFAWEESPASQNVATCLVEIDTSLNDVAWDGYRLFRPGRYYFRYFKLRATVRGNLATNQRPKITRMEHRVTIGEAPPHFGKIVSQTNPLPAAPVLGDKYIDSATGYVAICTDGTTPTWEYRRPIVGQRVFDALLDAEYRYTGSEWRESDDWKSCHGHIPIHGNDYSATGAGVWAVTIDAGQLHNGYVDNTGASANLDNISYKLCLKIGTYTLNFHTTEGPSHGIVDIDLIIGASTTEVASFDCYAVGLAKNIKKTQAGIAIMVPGLYELKARLDGKNGASAGFDAYIELITLYRTA